MRYEQFTNYEAACKDQGKDPLARPDFSAMQLTDVQKDIHEAGVMLDIIGVSINKDEDGNEWKPSPTERRYYVYFWIIEDNTRPLGFRLSFHVYVYAISLAIVASRLCFRDKNRALFAAEHHLDLFERILIPRF